MNKKLYKSDDRVLAGVLGGIANYINVDPTVVRIAFIVLALFTVFVPCLLFYIAAAIIMPDMPNFSARANEREDVTPDDQENFHH